jgi:hypothetical protein
MSGGRQMIGLEIAVLMLPGVVVAVFGYVWVSPENRARRQERHCRRVSP